jgi:hypothetical protein
MGRFWGWILRGRSQKILGKGIALPKRFFEWFMQKFWVKIALSIIYLVFVYQNRIIFAKDLSNKIFSGLSGLGLKKGAETKTNIAY